MVSLDPNIYAVGEPELLRTWPSFRRTADLMSGVEEIECGRMRWGLWFGPLVSAERRRWPAALRALEDSSGELSPDTKWPFVDCSATHFPALPLRCGSSSVAPVVRYATHNLNDRRWVTRRQKNSWHRARATGHPASVFCSHFVRLRTPALCPRTTTVACLRRPWPGKAAFFLLAAFVNSRVAALTAGCSTLRTRGCKRQCVVTSTWPKGWNVLV